MRRLAVHVASLTASLALLLSLGFLSISFAMFYIPSQLSKEVLIVIPRGTSLQQAADILEDSRVIESGLAFSLWVRAAGDQGSLKAGEYLFTPQIRGVDVARMLKEGEIFKRRVTIAEGLTTNNILELLSAAEGLEGPMPNDIKEGSLFPETYYYQRGDTFGGLVLRMQEAMSQVLEDLWSERSEGLPYNSPLEALILASIVERETGAVDERAHIAGIFINRLQMGMRLQSDPTVVYGLSRLVTDENPLSLEELQFDHAYNTYRHGGLPPGPISNPGRASIEAAVRPKRTKDLYFVANGEGGHFFAETLMQHNRNVAKYRALMADQ